MAKIIIANKNKKMDNLLMPCMYLTQDPFGSFSSFLLKYKYSPETVVYLKKKNYE